jgi:hypothetical protein
MPAPIYIPRRQNPWTNMMPGLLQSLVVQKIGQNMRLKEKEMEIKQSEQKMYYQMLPKTGTGIFDGDDPITFQKKAKNAYEMNLKERARRKFYMSSGKSYDDYKKAVASGKIMSLDETMEMINRKGAEVEAQLRASGKGLSDEQIAMQVKTILQNLYGN